MGGSLGHAYAVSGNRAEATRRLQELLDKSEREVVDCTAFILIHLGLGDREQALNWTEKAIEAKGFVSVGLNGDPRFDSLRGEPRFQAVIRRMNLTP